MRKKTKRKKTAAMLSVNHQSTTTSQIFSSSSVLSALCFLFLLLRYVSQMHQPVVVRVSFLRQSRAKAQREERRLGLKTNGGAYFLL